MPADLVSGEGPDSEWCLFIEASHSERDSQVFVQHFYDSANPIQEGPNFMISSPSKGFISYNHYLEG